MSELMTTKEASEYLKIGYMTLYKLAQQGEIPAYKIGSHWRFNRTALDDWFANKSRATNRNILVLGDDIDTAALSNTLTSINHYKVTTVSNLEQALTELEKRTYSIIFISPTTMNTDCSKIISEVRARNYKSIIVAGIGPDDKPISLDAMALGPTFVIKKPFEEADVLKMLNNADIQVTSKTNDQLIATLVATRQRIGDFSMADNERQVLEDSLQLSEDKLRNFMESSNDAFILTDKKLNIVEMNTSATRYLPTGMDRKNIIGKNILDISPSIKDILHKRYLELLKTNKPVEIDDVIIDTQRGTHMRAKAFKTGNGFGIIATDITDSKLLEALKTSEVFSSALLDNAPNPIMVYESDTSIRYVNKAFEDLTGFSLQEVEGEKIPYPWWEKDTIKKVLKTYKDPILPKPKKLEVRFKKKNGELFWVEVNAKTININDETFYYIVNWVEITERKALELSLRESEKKYKVLMEQRLKE
jgi:PAS domain S-box-containing protein/excisionase family DNA binding protein